MHMQYLSSCKLDQQVVKVTVTQPDDVTNHAHDGSGAVVGLSGAPPLGGACRRTPQLPAVTTTPNGLNYNSVRIRIFYSSELCINQELSVFTYLQ